MDEQYIKDLYSQLGSEDVFGKYEDFVTLITTDDSYIEDVYNNFGEETLGKFEDFKGLVKKQEELTPEMMETGQREAAPAYAMTEEKYAAEKKSAGESPLQDGVSVGAEADIPATPESGLETYEEEVKEQEVIETPEAGIEIQKEVDDVKITQESYKSKYDEFEKRRDELEKNINDLDLAANKIKLAREEGVDEASILKDIEDYNNRLKELQDEEKSLTDLQQEVESDYQKLDKMQKESLKEKNTWVEDQFGKNFLTDLMGDMARATGQGQAQGGVVMPAMTLFSKGADITEEEAQEFIDAANRMNSMPPSEEMQAFSKTYEEEGSGVWGWLKGMAENPTVIPQLFASSVSAMINEGSLYGGLAGGAAAAPAGLAGGPLAGVTVPAAAGMGFIGGVGATLETGLTFTELLTEELGDKEFTKDNVMEILRDEEKMKQIRWKAAGRGAAIGAIDAISGGLAGKATKAVAKATGRKMLAAGAGGTVEAIGGSIGEVGGRLAAGQPMDIAEIGFEGVAGTATAPITVGYGLVKSPVYKINGGTVSGPEMADFLRNARDQDVAGASIEIKNDSDLKSVAEERKSNAKTDAIIKRDLAEAGITDSGRVNELIPLEKEKKKLQGNTTEAGKRRLQEINAKIDEVIAKEPYEDAIQEQAAGEVPVQPETESGKEVEEGATEAKPEVTTEEKVEEVTEETLEDLENVPEPVIRGLAVKILNGETLTEQEQQVFDAQQEAVEQMASDIEQGMQAEAEVGGQLRGETSAEERSIIARQVNRAKRAISKILPDVEIVMHDTEDSYNEAVGGKEGQGTSGMYDPNSDKIHINMSKANPRTVAHEVFHAVVRRSIGGGKLSDPELNAATVKMLEAIRRGGSKKMLSAKSSLTGETVEDYIKRFSEDYDESVRSEEQLSELAGILAENFMELDVNNKTAIKAWIGRMAEKLGINKALGTKIYSQEMSDKDAIDLLNTIAGKTAKGEIIKEAKTLQDIFRDEDASIEETEGMTSRYQKNPDIKRIAEQYIDSNGLERMEQLEVRSIDPEYSKKMADVYEAAEDMPNDPEVQKAYKALAEESKKQFDLLVENGYSVEMFDGKGEPYANSKEMLADLKDNKRLVIFSTEEGFGQDGITDEQRAANPMLADSGRVDANGKPMLLNDLFRFVHDAFGHGELGNGFGPIGEENAWYVHSQMFSPEARRAMTSETRGQNSWVNYGKHIRREDGSIPKRSDSDFVPLSERDFAPQKNFLFPDEYVFDDPNMSDAQRIQDNVEPMVADIKKIPFKDEDGATMNIDGTRYEGGGLATPVGSINTDQESISSKSVSDFVSKNKAKISNDMFKIGLYKFPNSNKVSIDLNIVTPNENRQTAIEIAGMLGQESLFDLDTFENVKTGQDGMNPVELSDKEVAQVAEALAKNEVPEFLKTKFQKTIKATIDFKSRTGRSFSISKEFNNQQHLDNYIKFRERKGDKEVGVNIEEAKEVEAPKTQKRLFAKKAVINVGNNITGETTLEVGKIRPIMINGQEFARMTAIDIPQDNKFASTERDLYTRSVETVVSEGLGGLVIPRSVFNEIAVDENRFDVKKRGDELVVTERPYSDPITYGQISSTINTDASPRYQMPSKIDLKRFPVNKNTKVQDETAISNFSGKRVSLMESDRMTGAYIEDSEGHPAFKFFGGIYYPVITGKWWASRNESKARSIAKSMNQARDSDGYIYSAPMIMSKASHMSNQDMFEAVWEFMKKDLRSKSNKVTKAKFHEYVIKALSLKKIGMKESDIGINKSDSIELMISKLDKILHGEYSSLSFEKRRAIVTSLLGNPKKSDERRFPSAGSIFEIATAFEEPLVKKASKLWDVVMIMRTKGELTSKLTPRSDEFFHKSYPAEISSDKEIEVFFLDGAYNVKDIFPKLDKSSGGSFTWKEYVEKHPASEFALSQYGRTAKLSKASGIVSYEDVVELENRYQNPAATAYTIHDAINELRGKGYTESAIALFISRQINPDTQKKYTKGEVTALLEIPVDIESTLPSAFGDVEGGVAQGQKMFTEVMEKVRRSAARMRPANSSKIRAKAHQILMAHPDFDKQSATVKNRLILGLDSALGTTANKAIQAEISAIKKMIKGGKISLKELKKAQVRLRAMIRKELPNDKAYSKTVVNNLIKMVTDATPETMDQVVKDVTSTINEQRSERFISEIEKILDQKFERTEAGRKKGTKVTATFADAIAFAKSKLEEIRKASENEDDFHTVMEKTRAERDALFSEIDTMTEEDISMVLAYDLVLQYGKTFVESNTEQDTVDGLELSLDMAKDLINTGRAFMKDQLRLAHEAYKEQFNTAFEDITGIDMRGMDEDQRADVSGSFRIGAEQRGKNLNRAAKAMMRVVDRANRFFAKNEDLAGFMDILSSGAGEMFGGKLQELVKQRVDDSSTVFKRGMMDMRAMVEAKQREIFGKGWKKVMANNRVPIKTGLTAFGKELTYSQNEMYYLYNMAKDPANHPSFEKKFGKEWRSIMDGIEELMTPEIKEWADWQVNEFYPMMWERYNPVYRRIYRTNLGWNKFYAGKIYRQSIDGSEDIDLLEQKMGPSMSVAGGSTKHRVKNNMPIAAVDGNLAMGRYLEEMEKFRAYQETVRDVSKIFNNKDIKNAIIEKYGKGFHDLFSTMLERYLTGRMERGNLGSIVGTGNRVFIFSKLGYNLSLVWKQLTSIPTYANDIGFVNWGVYAAKAATSRKILSKEMYENSTYLQDRYAGDFMGVVDVFSKNKENTMSVGAGADFYINEASDAVMRYGMLYTKAGDALAIFLGGSPNYLYYKDQFKKKNPNATEQEAINYAIKKFEKDTRGTQQSNDIQDRDFYQTGNEFMRSMMLFTTSPRQYWRKSMSGYRQLYRKMKGVPSKGSITDNLRTIVMYRFMMPMMYTWATMGFPAPWDLDDEEQDELMWSALLGNISALFMIGHIGIALKDFMTGKPWAGRMPLPPIMQIASDIIEDMMSISKTKDPLERSIKEEEMYMKMVSNVVPSKNLDKSFGNWYRTASGDQDFNALKMAGYSDYIADRDERKMKEEMDALLKMFEQVNKGKGSDSREMKEIKELKEIR